jgi:hypothetical protein
MNLIKYIAPKPNKKSLEQLMVGQVYVSNINCQPRLDTGSGFARLGRVECGDLLLILEKEVKFDNHFKRYKIYYKILHIKTNQTFFFEDLPFAKSEKYIFTELKDDA